MVFFKLSQHCRAGLFQPSLRDYSFALTKTQDFVLGYIQPSLRDWLVRKGVFPQPLKPGQIERTVKGGLCLIQARLLGLSGVFHFPANYYSYASASMGSLRAAFNAG